MCVGWILWAPREDPGVASTHLVGW
jgi:hypothetical protein